MKNWGFNLFIVCFSLSVSAQSFTPGNIVVLGVGDGSTALTDAAAPVFLYEYTATGTLVTTTSLPTITSGGNARLSQSGSSILEGHLSLSDVGNCLVLAGYDASIGTPNVVASASPGVIGRIDKDRTVNTTNTFQRTSGNPYNGGNFRAVASPDGQQFLLSGNSISSSNGGIYYYPDGGPVGTHLPSFYYTGATKTLDGNLFYTRKNSDGTYGLGLIGQSFTNEPIEFVFLDVSSTVSGYDLLYVVNTGLPGGIYKYSYDGSIWTSRGNLTGACGGLTARRKCGGGVDLFMTLFDGGITKPYQTQLVRFTDNAPFNLNITGNGSSAEPLPMGVSTLLATAAANTAFCGVAFTPMDGIIVNSGTSLNLSAGNYNSIFIENNSTVTLTGDLTLYDRVLLKSGGTLVMNNYTLQGAAGIGSLFVGRGGGSILKIGSPYGITVSTTGVTGGNIQTCFRRYGNNSIYEYNGTVPQLTGNGLPGNIQSIGLVKGRLVINNSSGMGTDGVTLTQPTIISAAGELVLSNGKLTTSSMNGIFVDAAGFLITSYTDTSFVNGPFNRYGNTTFKFPVGKGNSIHPLELVATGSGNPNDFYTAEYFKANPSTVCSSANPSGSIVHVSGLEYWNLKTFLSMPTAASNQVTLWATTYSDATDRDKLVIARCDAPTWTDLGNGNLSFTGAYGPVISSLSVSGNFNSNFTLASTEVFPTNPLPINLISFDATKLTETTAYITWELGTVCSSAAKFEIQRANADKSLSKIVIINSNGTNRLYSYTDNGLKKGVNYYRLKMTDEDGKITYSRTVAVMNGVNGLLLTSLIPTMVANTATLTVASSKQQKLDLVITDMQGRIVMKQNNTIAAGNTNIQLSTGRLAAGIYLLTGVTSEGNTNMIRFIKQ